MILMILAQRTKISGFFFPVAGAQQILLVSRFHSSHLVGQAGAGWPMTLLFIRHEQDGAMMEIMGV